VLGEKALTPMGRAAIIGLIVTLGSGLFSVIRPEASNYLFLPGMMVVYVASGGVHGYSSGVYLPTLPVWYALGGIVNLILYTGIAFAVSAMLQRNK
jgi:hypothetical protein